MTRSFTIFSTIAVEFSRMSGPFWQKTGFTSADTKDLAAALASTHQVQLFTETGQVKREAAWSRKL
ncbi:hypothetical protein GCM10025778_15070 [Paeniglutamicibacter antarcticus]|uniref:Uncharacterized protein n=1 Tax=Paeniglutamicibacter antarcticus TaxID=494023 RepID=A0ABP9TPD8_9MICC